MNKKEVIKNYDQTVDGIDGSIPELKNAEQLLNAQYDELSDIGDLAKDTSFTDVIGGEFKHYYHQLLTLNVETNEIIDRQCHNIEKHVKPTRIGLNKLMDDDDKEKSGVLHD